jgi:hypothetical protein
VGRRSARRRDRPVRSRGSAHGDRSAELIDTIGEEIALRVSPTVPRDYTSTDA